MDTRQYSHNSKKKKKESLKVIKLWYKYVLGLAYRFLEKMAEFVFK